MNKFEKIDLVAKELITNISRLTNIRDDFKIAQEKEQIDNIIEDLDTILNVLCNMGD